MRENKYDKEKLKNIIDNSNTLSEVCDNLKLGITSCNKNTIKKYIKLYDIDTSHFFKKNAQGEKVSSLEEILVENSTYSRIHLKERLYKEGIKERICELCGQNEFWNNKKMSLILDHINGINNDNRLNNLRIVCPNCNATLETHCKGSGKKYTIKDGAKNKIFCECGEEMSKTSKKCRNCSNKSLRVIERPPYEQLLSDYEKYGYLGTSKIYNVTGNTIKRWLKTYEKQNKIKIDMKNLTLQQQQPLYKLD